MLHFLKCHFKLFLIFLIISDGHNLDFFDASSLPPFQNTAQGNEEPAGDENLERRPASKVSSNSKVSKNHRQKTKCE